MVRRGGSEVVPVVPEIVLIVTSPSQILSRGGVTDLERGFAQSSVSGGVLRKRCSAELCGGVRGSMVGVFGGGERSSTGLCMSFGRLLLSLAVSPCK